VVYSRELRPIPFFSFHCLWNEEQGFLLVLFSFLLCKERRAELSDLLHSGVERVAQQINNEVKDGNHMAETEEETQKLKIYHITFSPTRGSYHYGSYLANKLGTEVLIDKTLPAERIDDCVLDQENQIIVVSYPCYGGRMPSLFSAYFKNHVHLAKGSSVILLTSYGNRHFDDALVEGFDLVKEKGAEVIGATAMVTEHVYTNKVGTGRPNTSDYAVLDAFSSVIQRRLQQGEKLTDVEGNRPYKTGAAKKAVYFMPERNEALCSHCNACYAVCPTGALSANDPQACLHCLACVKACKSGALTMDMTYLQGAVTFLETHCSKQRESIYC